MTAPRVSLAQQAEAVEFACVRQATIAAGGTVRSARPKSVEEFDLARLQAAFRTLRWLIDHEATIRAFLALPAEDRALVVSHGPLVADLARQIVEREAVARAGGPVR